MEGGTKRPPVPGSAHGQEITEDTLENLGFEKFAPYLKDPLVLVGFVLLLFFGIARFLIKSRLLTPVSGIKSYRLLQTILLCGFVLSIMVIGLGFGLKYRELSETEQRNAVGLMHREMDANLASVEALRRNTITMLEIVQRTASSLRSPEVKVLAVLFPAKNLQSGTTTPPKQLALDALSQLLESKLDRNRVEMARGDAVAKIIRSTIDRTRPTIASLSDPSRERYVIRDAAWQANLPVLRKVYIEGVPELQKSYVAAQKLRADYDVICTSVLAYLDALHAVFNKEPGVTIESLTAALTQERQTLALLAAYGGALADNMAELKATQSKFDRPAGMSGT